MLKKTKYLFVFLLSFITVITFSPSKIYASLMIGGDSFETITEGGDVFYFSLNPVMKKLGGVESKDSKNNTFKYTISYKDKQDYITFDKNNYQVSVNGTLIKDKYYEENNQIYVPMGVFDKMNTTNVVESNLMETFIVTPPEYKYNDIVPYNLGEDKYLLKDKMYNILDEHDNSKYMKYNNTGSVSVPNGKKLPLVIFLHGSYAGNGISTYFDIGFSDNMKALANEGFVSLGMNLTPVYSLDASDSDKEKLYGAQKDLFSKIFKKHVQSLLDSVNKDTTNNIYGFDMKDKIDFNNIILVGHSRGGQNIFLGYEILKEMGLNVKGNISIAPANYWRDFNKYPDIPTGIILPQLDGDVHTLEGRQIFDTMRLQKRDKDLQLLYLYSANHNNFNSTIFKEDNSFVDDKGETLKEPMSGKEQRAFASKYIVDFSKSAIDKGNLSKISASKDGTLYNKKVLMSFIKGNSNKLFDANSESDFKNFSGNYKKIIASKDKQKHTAGNIRLPGLSEYYPLVSLDFKNTNDKVSYKILENNDFTKFNTLSFEIMQDSTNPLNKGVNQIIDITLTDKNGASHTISTPLDSSALQHQPGEMARMSVKDEYPETMYSNFTPLSTLMIPLTEFKGKIDPSNISKVEISPSKSVGQGSFVLQSIYLSSINDQEETITPENAVLGVGSLKSVAIYIFIFCIISSLLFICYKKTK